MIAEPEHTIDDQLRVAIENKRLIEIRYHGRARIAEPHDYGVIKGVEKLLVYQRRGVDGVTERNMAGWRFMEAAKIEGCRVLDEAFRGSRAQLHRNHVKWDILYARVK